MYARLLALTLAHSLLAIAAAAEQPAVRPLTHAHAHNDYEHKRPLSDALAHGFCSVEADIWLEGGELLVGHDRKDLRPGRTLESLYLQPLAERVKASGGRVYPGGPVFYLLIDVKTEADSTYDQLRQTLLPYAHMLTTAAAGRRQERAVTVILSGNRAAAAVTKEHERLLALDGRPENLDTNPPADLFPWISANWKLLFKNKPDGTLPESERTRLRAFVNKAHEQGRQVRFWATPENPTLWTELLDAGVDYLNTDQLAALQQFLLERK